MDGFLKWASCGWNTTLLIFLYFDKLEKFSPGELSALIFDYQLFFLIIQNFFDLIDYYV